MPAPVQGISVLFDGPVADIPEDTYTVVSQDSVAGDALDVVVCHIHGVNVTEEGESGICSVSVLSGMNHNQIATGNAAS